MKTIKVIDLYNKIANGEEVPKKLRLKDKLYKDLYYQYNERYNCYDLLGKNLKAGCYVFGYSELNDELEIIEDTPEKNKKIEKLDFSDWWEITCDEDFKPDMFKEIFNKNAKAFSSKINEIIDKVNGK